MLVLVMVPVGHETALGTRTTTRHGLLMSGPSLTVLGGEPAPISLYVLPLNEQVGSGEAGENRMMESQVPLGADTGNVPPRVKLHGPRPVGPGRQSPPGVCPINQLQPVVARGGMLTFQVNDAGHEETDAGSRPL
jgi:hypothetical protein